MKPRYWTNLGDSASAMPIAEGMSTGSAAPVHVFVSSFSQQVLVKPLDDRINLAVLWFFPTVHEAVSDSGNGNKLAAYASLLQSGNQNSGLLDRH